MCIYRFEFFVMIHSSSFVVQLIINKREDKQLPTKSQKASIGQKKMKISSPSNHSLSLRIYPVKISPLMADLSHADSRGYRSANQMLGCNRQAQRLWKHLPGDPNIGLHLHQPQARDKLLKDKLNALLLVSRGCLGTSIFFQFMIRDSQRLMENAFIGLFLFLGRCLGIKERKGINKHWISILFFLFIQFLGGQQLSGIK